MNATSQHNNMIIVTGAAGFIGSCMVGYLNDNGYSNIVLVDDFSRKDKLPNYEKKQFKLKVEREDFFNWLSQNNEAPEIIIHIGARTDTTEFDYCVHQKLNVEYSQKIWSYCTEKNIPLIYASSAATYGAGEKGYKDEHEIISNLKPLNPYGESKNNFDKWALDQKQAPGFWAGLKFFNVYGPNEYHKARMASVIWHSFNQIKNTGQVKLFKSHKPEFKDGEQLRDFIYVKDVIKVMGWMMVRMLNKQWPAANNGIYNLGTGKARTFNDLVTATFNAIQKPRNIVYIDMPEDLRDTYQYFTEAEMHKLKDAGYKDAFYTLEEGINDYVKQYLMDMNYL